MASNDIGDDGVAALARLLDDEPSGYRCVLSTLDLRGNSIGAKGCQVIVGTTEIELSYCLNKLCLACF